MTRRHDIDALRVIALCLLIVYHVGMVYVADWGFHVKSTYQADWLQWPMIFMNRWRMPLLFMISGIAIALFQPARAPGRFALTRTWRLLLPLVFGMFVIVPVQAYCEGRSLGKLEPGFGAFLWSYVHVHRWPAGSFTGWQFGITWNHLWYLAYLWIYTLILTLALPVLESSIGLRAQRWLSDRRGTALFVLPALAFFAYRWFLGPYFPATHALFGDWFDHAEYFTAFLIGYAIARNAGFWERVKDHRSIALLIALVSFSAYAWLRAFDDLDLLGSAGDLWRFISQSSQALFMWSTLLAIFGYGHAYLSRPMRWLPYASEAVYPWYILHQSLIIVIAYNLIPLHIGQIAEPIFVLLGTVAGCVLLHEFVIRRIAVLRPLFGLKREKVTVPVKPRLDVVYSDTN